LVGDYCPDIIHQNFIAMLAYEREFQSADRFAAHGDSQRRDEPHVIITMKQFYKGDQKISRGEILAILSVLIMQLDHALQSYYITSVSCLELFLDPIGLFILNLF
jgi:hypothetical protein